MKCIQGVPYAHERADDLAWLLDSKGFSVTVYNKGGHADHPCVKVESGRWGLIDRTEYVYLAPAEDGRWWFWDTWLEPIAPAKEVSIAADKVARAVAAFRHGRHLFLVRD